MAVALLIAVASARNYPSSPNDTSRLATVESLVDHHTFAIDRSIFVQWAADKLLIKEHFYSDKPPIPQLWMAGWYQALQWATGLRAKDSPRRFCYWMTLGSSGLGYVVAVLCIYWLGQRLELPLLWRLLLTASFGLSTAALVYARQVNSHILLLAITSALVLCLIRMAQQIHLGPIPWRRVFGLGSLAGLGYTIDLGVGPVLLLCTLGLMVYRLRSFNFVAVFLMAALPWLALHHAVNYAVAGTLMPASMVMEYLQWPGSPWTPENITGRWNHSTIGHFLSYSAALLVGERGFIGHNLPLALVVPGGVALLRRRGTYFPEILHAGCLIIGTWLVYALGSTNYSGDAASIRWFVPLLAPGYLILALSLRETPQYLCDFLVLSAWGSIVGGMMWWQGPWMQGMVPFFWHLQVAALLTWALCWARRARET
jgi:hypothetical protein